MNIIKKILVYIGAVSWFGWYWLLTGIRFIDFSALQKVVGVLVILALGYLTLKQAKENIKNEKYLIASLWAWSPALAFVIFFILLNLFF